MGEDEKGGNMKTCKCEHWEVCPVCKPEWFDRWGNRLPPEPTPLQKANGRIEELEQQLATFHSAVEHVTEDGCTRRSFVAMPEGWAMVHKDRLHALELAEEQLAATDGLDQYILCEKEPVVWMQSDHLSRFVHHACGAQSALVRCSDHQLMPDFQPLYRAMKVRVAREKNAKNC